MKNIKEFLQTIWAMKWEILMGVFVLAVFFWLIISASSKLSKITPESIGHEIGRIQKAIDESK